jgi:hypothetical protein
MENKSEEKRKKFTVKRVIIGLIIAAIVTTGYNFGMSKFANYRFSSDVNNYLGETSQISPEASAKINDDMKFLDDYGNAQTAFSQLTPKAYQNLIMWYETNTMGYVWKAMRGDSY